MAKKPENSTSSGSTATDSNGEKKHHPFIPDDLPELDESDFAVVSYDDVRTTRVHQGRDYAKLHKVLPSLKVGQALKISSEKLKSGTARSHLYNTMMLREYLKVTEDKKNKLTIIVCLKVIPKDFKTSVTSMKKKEQEIVRRRKREQRIMAGETLREN